MWEFWFFVGWCLCRWNPTGLLIFGVWVLLDEGVWQDQKCHRFGAVCPIVPPLKIMCCPACDVPDVCSRCAPVHPDVFVLYQHLYMLCLMMLWCGRCVYIWVLLQLCLYYVMFKTWDLCIYYVATCCWHCLWHCMCNFLCATPFYA